MKKEEVNYIIKTLKEYKWKSLLMLH
jgi:hypothetical protein